MPATDEHPLTENRFNEDRTPFLHMYTALSKDLYQYIVKERSERNL